MRSKPLLSGSSRIICYTTLLVILATGCTTTGELVEEWSRKVDEGEYGWINFNEGTYENLDLPPQPKGGELTSTMSPEHSARCLARLIEFNRDIRVEVRFLIDGEGKGYDYLVVNRDAGPCGRDAISALSGIRFDPGYKNGEVIPVVGAYTIYFRHKWN